MQHTTPRLLTAADIAGTLVFAVEGALTGVGGGTLRNVLTATVPAVLRADFYATAAIAGATLLVLARMRGASPAAAGIAGGVVVFALRMTAVLRGWTLPGVD